MNTDETREALTRAIGLQVVMPCNERSVDIQVALAAHERAIRAEALREAIENIYDAGLSAYATNDVVSWLTVRADRIESEARG